MSYPANTTLTVRDGQMALAATPTEIPLVIGCSSSGTVATLYDYSDGNAALDALGYGPLTEVGLPVVEAAGRALFLKLTGSVAAANSAVTTTRFASSVGTLTIAGTAYRDYRWRVEILTTTSALGSGTFRYTLDNANTWSDPFTIPSGGTFSPEDSGITWTFALQSGTPDFEDGDIFSGTCTSAHWNTTNLAAGITALLASPLLIGKKIRKVYFTGIPADAATAATNAAAIATHMATLEDRDHFARSIMDCGSIDTEANVLANFVAAFSDTRVFPMYGRCERTSPAPIQGFGLPYVSSVLPAAVRATEAEISEQLGRVASGPLVGVKSTTLEQDEEAATAFSFENKIGTLRTNRNKPGGAYITFGFLKSPAGSDFIAWDYGVTLDSACQTIVAGLANWTLAKLAALNDGTGHLHPLSAQRVKQSIDGPLGALMNVTTIDGLPSHVSGQEFTVATAYDYAALRVLRCTYKMNPNPASEGAEVAVGLTRQITEAA